jgi:phage baseplate assembly protein W
MRGINANTGKSFSGLAHLQQSVTDILSTPIGSRVMRREYGSQLFRLIDAPLNRSTVMDLYAATAEALRRWEPRFRLTNVQASQPEPGRVTLDLTGIYLPEGREISLEGIEVT